MGRIIGIDEAGYGPNLGPLVVSATVWEVPGAPHEPDLWRALAGVLAPSPQSDRLHVGDSKAVFTPARGIAALERAVLAAADVAGCRIETFRALCATLAPRSDASATEEPWLAGADLALPAESHEPSPACWAQRWRCCGEACGVHLRAVRSDIVPPSRFNQLTRTCGNKAAALSHISLKLLRSVWDPDDEEPAAIIADKHGGRNRYDEFLCDIVGDRLVFRREESRNRSRYRVGNADICFQMRGEAHLPVALASMVSKYVRELWMRLFNRFWQEHVPGLRATQGYPLDARRFKADIADAQARLGIADDVLWRER